MYSPVLVKLLPGIMDALLDNLDDMSGSGYITRMDNNFLHIHVDGLEIGLEGDGLVAFYTYKGRRVARGLEDYPAGSYAAISIPTPCEVAVPLRP